MLPAVSWVFEHLCPSCTANELVVIVVVVGGSISDVVTITVVIIVAGLSASSWLISPRQQSPVLVYSAARAVDRGLF